MIAHRRTIRVLASLLMPLTLAQVTTACTSGGPGADEEFRPLFNGRDLSGWVNVNGGPETWTVQDEMIVCSGKPTGVLRTERHYENFVLELEYRHVQEGGNAGVFVWSDPVPAPGVPFTRSVEIQVLDGVEHRNYTSHGDVFAIHGATLVPDRPQGKGKGKGKDKGTSASKVGKIRKSKGRTNQAGMRDLRSGGSSKSDGDTIVLTSSKIKKTWQDEIVALKKEQRKKEAEPLEDIDYDDLVLSETICSAILGEQKEQDIMKILKVHKRKKK